MKFKTGTGILNYRFHKGHAFIETDPVSICGGWFVSHKVDEDKDGYESVRCCECRVKLPAKNHMIVDIPLVKKTKVVIEEKKKEEELKCKNVDLSTVRTIFASLTDKDKGEWAEELQKQFKVKVQNVPAPKIPELLPKYPLPCVFCGYESAKVLKFKKDTRVTKNKKDIRYQVICNKCSSRGPIEALEKDAILKWNTPEK